MFRLLIRRSSERESNHQVLGNAPGLVAAVAAHRPLPGVRPQNHQRQARAYLLLRRAGELPVSDLARRQASNLSLRAWPGGRELLAARREAVVRATRVQAAAHVTRLALQEAGSLSALEARLLRDAPLGGGALPSHRGCLRCLCRR